jgi:hypothetical protein
MSQLGGRQTAGWPSREKMVAMVQHEHQAFLLPECYCCVFVCVAKKANSRYLEGGNAVLSASAQSPGNLAARSGPRVGPPWFLLLAGYENLNARNSALQQRCRPSCPECRYLEM